MEPKEYDRLVRSIEKMLDRSSFSPNMLAVSISCMTTPRVQRQLAATILLLLLKNWEPVFLYNSIDEEWLADVAKKIGQIMSMQSVFEDNSLPY